MDCSLPGSFVHGMLQAKILEWVAISFFGDLLDPGIEAASLTSTCIGRWVLLPLHHLGSPISRKVVDISFGSYCLELFYYEKVLELNTFSSSIEMIV